MGALKLLVSTCTACSIHYD